MAGWRGGWKRAGLLGIAIVASLALGSCGMVPGQTAAATGASTTATPATSSGTGTAGGSGAAGSGQGPGGSGQGPGGSGQGGSGSGRGVSAAEWPKPKAPALPVQARLGDHGKGVAALQRRLAALGYEVREADGEFGAATQHAVVAFQKVSHLSRDGVAGPRTMKALAHPRRPSPRTGGRGMHLEADLTLQVVYVVDNGRVQRILDASSASGARYLSQGEARVAHTPEGSFQIGRKVDGWHRSNLGLLYRPAYFDGPYAIHGALSVPPYPASHGCIRVTTASMDALYSRLAPGTGVLVYRT